MTFLPTTSVRLKDEALTYSVPLHVVLHDPAHDLPPEIDLVGVPEVGKVRGRVPHDLESRPQVATPEPVQQSVQSTEVHPERDRRLQVDEVEEPVDADLSDGSRRQAPDEGQVHVHVCMIMMIR